MRHIRNYARKDLEFGPASIKDYVSLAAAEGFRPSSVDQARLVLKRYREFLQERCGLDLDTARWTEFGAYEAHLAEARISRTTVRGYLSYILSYYRLKAQT